MLASLDHPNVVRYHECFAERDTKLKIVMELCEVHASTASRVAWQIVRCLSLAHAADGS